jgi:25S rRNA (uracil2843-N3)-methyltransferase
MSAITCLGAGNGSELVGLLGTLLESGRPMNETPPLNVSLHDMADYGILPQILDAFSSKDTQAMQSLNVKFEFPICDLLVSSSSSSTADLLKADLVTAFFLLNELLTTSKAGFAKLIKSLMDSMAPGSFLLVVDSAGSFSECVVGSSSSTTAESPPSAHMVYKFLDAIHCLECLHSQDSVWYRFPKDLRYPVKLNNMRYFIRLYRKRS